MKEPFSIEDRFELLSRAEGSSLISLADEVLAGSVEVKVVAGPEAASTPITMKVPGTSTVTAELGHLAVSTCRVEIDGARGDGIRPGHDLEGALAAAVCDAVAGSKERKAAVDTLCQNTLRLWNQRASERAAVVRGTWLEGDSHE